jgi:hypothetical protein
LQPVCGGGLISFAGHITVLPREPLAAADRKCPNSEAFVLI